MIKVDREHVAVKKIKGGEFDFAKLAPEKRVAFIWELTAEIWSLKDKTSAKRRLQRHITKLIKK